MVASEQEEIKQVIYKLLLTIDEKDEAGFEAILTGEDTVFNLDGWKTESASKISKVLKDQLEPLQTTHFAHNTIVDIQESTAIASFYGLNQHYLIGTGPEGNYTNKLLAASRNEIHLVKVDGNWKAKVWNFSLKWRQGNTSIFEKH